MKRNRSTACKKDQLVEAPQIYMLVKQFITVANFIEREEFPRDLYLWEQLTIG